MNEQQTRAETQVPSIIPGVSPSSEQAIGVSGLFGAIVWAIFHFRRKASRDNVEITKDRIEGKMFEDMIKDRQALLMERDAAKTSEREAWTQNNTLAVENQRLRSDNEYQQREIARLTQAMQQLQIDFDQIKIRLQKLASNATGHTGFDEIDG